MSKILVTGSAGFIGSCLISALDNTKNEIYTSDYTGVLDNYYVHPFDLDRTFLCRMDKIVHLGAISETNAASSEKVFNQNILATMNIIQYAKPECKIIYASSASVYGVGASSFCEDDNKVCVSQYARSKLIIDDIVNYFLPDRNLIGLRFFNVCSFHNEKHKQQPSPTYKFLDQLLTTKEIKLFHGSDQIYRDFIFIDDVINIIKFFLDENHKTNIFNIGSGLPVSFENIADALIDKLGFGKKIYIDRPINLTNNYQEYTCANITKLRTYGYTKEIPSVIEYIKNYARPN